MALSRYAPDLYQTFAFQADATIPANSVAVGSTADGHITAPAGAPVTGGVIGVPLNAIANGAIGDVVTAGIVKIVANAAITRYQDVVVASVAGDVRNWTQADGDVGAQIVGLALESVATAGDLVSVLLRVRGNKGGSTGYAPAFYAVRGLVLTAVASLAAFAVAGNDGVTYVQGDRVLLAGQPTGSQNGIYVVGTVAAGAAPLTRAADFPTGALVPAESYVAISEGTLGAHSLYRLASQGSAQVIDTASLTFLLAADAGASVNRQVRGVVTANVASLAAFAAVAGGTPFDGVTYVQGDRVLLAAQTTASQCGVYIVGPVAAGTAPLTLASDYATGFVKAGMVFEVSEGTHWAGSSWKLMGTQTGPGGYITVGTTDPAFWPRMDYATIAIGTPNTAMWIRGVHQPIALNDTTSSTTGTKAVQVAGRGSGSITLTGTGTDSVDCGTFNW